MIKIAFHVQKGGTGKTTTTGNIGFEMAKSSRVLMVDGDPQGNLTSWYCPEGISYDLADVLQEKIPLKQAIQPIAGISNLDILGTIAIDGELKEWSETKLSGEMYAFHDLLDQIKELGYDAVIFDLSPGMSLLERSILSVMDEIIPVIASEFFSLDGIEIAENELQKIRKKMRGNFKADRLVINRLNKSYSSHRGILEELEKLDYQTYVIGQSTGISDAVLNRMSLSEYDNENKNLEEYNRLVTDLMGVR
ncbi:ParA family protein [Oceanispirochaeta sp. M1]|uniref:ParA family protein n=1 Tax=Oceanispirochaeta sp. M1 TaxID=2283433 RepID=UPI000E099654|nr:ParA family protein [Oceanispirochaeta sp. M1]NPD75315.1 ParA family protein [Oceanispirochaeta sp. M1]RDG28838.1 ParA family protein [Oceanispirochaeta sp. M1]